MWPQKKTHRRARKAEKMFWHAFASNVINHAALYIRQKTQLDRGLSHEVERKWNQFCMKTGDTHVLGLFQFCGSHSFDFRKNTEIDPSDVFPNFCCLWMFHPENFKEKSAKECPQDHSP